MRLVHAEYGLSLEMFENEVSVLVIENRGMMQELIEELYYQCEGSDGRFVLSAEEKIQDVEKKMEMIIDPFSLDINNRKVLTKLYQEIDELIKENLYKEQIELNAHISGFVQYICDLTPYHLNFLQEHSSLDIIKLANVKIEVEEMTMLERLTDYIGLMGDLCHYCIFVFINLKSYLPDASLEKLYEYARYHKVQLLLIENQMRNKLDTEMITIIDVDKCIF